MVVETPAENKEQDVAGEGAEERRGKCLPRCEDTLVDEEAAEDCDAFSFRDAAEKDRKQPVFFDEMMDRVGHERGFLAWRKLLFDPFQLCGYLCDVVAHADDLAVAQFVELFMQRHDLDLGLEVDLIVMRGIEPVAFGLPVLRHHDHRRLQRRDHRQNEIEEDKGVGVEGAVLQKPDIGARPDDQEGDEGQDERPRAADAGDGVGDPVAKSSGSMRERPMLVSSDTGLRSMALCSTRFSTSLRLSGVARSSQRVASSATVLFIRPPPACIRLAIRLQYKKIAGYC